MIAIGALAAHATAAELVIPRAELPGLGAIGSRHPIDPRADPWRSLGRVQTELGSRCTGVLIAADWVLTAAHCLTAPRGDRFVRPGSVHVLMGYTAGHATAHRRVTAFQTGAGYTPAAGGPPAADWAMLRLETPLPEMPALPLRPARAGDPVLLGGYQQDRPEVIMADTNCRILDVGQSPEAMLLLHNCAGTRGASGGPLLRRDAPGGWSVVGVAVAAARQRAGGIAIPAQAIGR